MSPFFHQWLKEAGFYDATKNDASTQTANGFLAGATIELLTFADAMVE
jgi:hypothetical protein